MDAIIGHSTIIFVQLQRETASRRRKMAQECRQLRPHKIALHSFLRTRLLLGRAICHL